MARLSSADPDAPREGAGAGEPPREDLDWHAWHSGYEREDSPLARRLALVQAQLGDALDRAPAGPVRIVSVCAGQGHDVIGVLARHPRREHVSARLVELDPQNVALAQRAAAAAGLDGVQAVAADASMTDAYLGATPADVILVCGVLGNVAEGDVERTIEHLPELCAPGATVIWTRHRHAPDLVPRIVSTFERVGFERVAFADAPPFAVGANRLRSRPRPLRLGVRLFDFVGQGALWPHLSARRREALSALFRPDSSLVELVEAMRALPNGRPSEDTAECMLSEGRGTSSTKHLFLAQVIAQRFPEAEPALVHRVHRLDRARARDLYGEQVAATVPVEGLIDVHRYLTIVVTGRRIVVDATVAGEPWDGSTPLGPGSGPGTDFPAGADPDADRRALESAHCEVRARAGFDAALASAGAPPQSPDSPN